MKRLLPRGATRALMAVSAAAVLVLAAWLSARYELRWRWAGSGAGELSAASERLVAGIAKPLALTVALPQGHALHTHVRELTDAYRRAGVTLQLTFLDPAQRPQRARELGLVRTGEALLEYAGRFERVAVPSEDHVSAALERLQRRGDAFVAYLTGHGERSLEGEANFDLGQFGAALTRKGYRLQPLSLVRTPSIPDNTALLVVASPRSTLLPGERSLLRAYIARGGALLWLTEPADASIGLPEVLPVGRGQGTVSDPAGSELLGVDNPSMLLVDNFPSHPATADLASPLLLVGSAALQVNGAKDWSAQALLRTAAQRGSSDAAATPSAQTVGVALSREVGDSVQRVAILGDGDVLANAYLGNGDNLRFGLNLVDWLTGADRFIGTYADAAADQRLALGETATLVIGFGLLLGLPGGCLLGAFWAWRRRRRG